MRLCRGGSRELKGDHVVEGARGSIRVEWLDVITVLSVERVDDKVELWLERETSSAGSRGD